MEVFARMQQTMRNMFGVDVTREYVEDRLGPGQEMIHVGWPLTLVAAPPQVPRPGQMVYDAATDCYKVYAGSAWQELRSNEDLFVPRAREWRCAYCRTVFAEQRCPTCGAGRSEG